MRTAKWFRRGGSLLLAAAVFFSFSTIAELAPAGPGTVLASAAETDAADDTLLTGTCMPDGELADNDVLFADYVESVLYPELQISLYGNYAASYFDADSASYSLYTQLKSAVTEIAAGGGSTKISLDSPVVFTYTDCADTAEAETALAEDIRMVLNLLAADCPSELYWFDKYSGINYDYNYSSSGDVITLTVISLSMYVASAYQDGSSTVVSSDAASSAVKAADVAGEVVEQYSDCSDYEKLVAYKDWICEAVSYCTDYADYYTAYGYGDPWQIIYVFDGDEDTNVVCEGYAKAFQYLCDLSDFDGDIVCYTVSGTLSGDAIGTGSHMWNIVKMEDDQYYLADLTNSDTGTLGAYGGLFLAGNADGSVADGYSFALSYSYTEGNYTYVSSGSSDYAYDEDTLAIYGSTILTLASSDYVYSSDTDDGDGSDDGSGSGSDGSGSGSDSDGSGSGSGSDGSGSGSGSDGSGSGSGSDGSGSGSGSDGSGSGSGSDGSGSGSGSDGSGSGITNGNSKTNQTALKKAVIKKAKSKKKKTITVKWKKVSGAKKYQVSYRIKGKKKWKTVSVKKTSKTIKKLKSKKKYQIRVRAVGKSGTKTVYGKWSKVKTVKVK